MPDVDSEADEESDTFVSNSSLLGSICLEYLNSLWAMTLFDFCILVVLIGLLYLWRSHHIKETCRHEPSISLVTV